MSIKNGLAMWSNDHIAGVLLYGGCGANKKSRFNWY